MRPLDPWLFLAAFGVAVSHLTPATAQRLGTIAVVESIPGGIWDEHAFFDGMDVRFTHPESVGVRYGWHAGAVAARIFEDNHATGAPIDAGLADRDAWDLWSYQAQTTGFFAEAWEQIGREARIANHSIGYSGSTSGESMRAQAMDRAAYEGRVLITQAAHNQGPFEGTLREPAGGYNMITVAASGPAESTPDEDYFRGEAEGAFVAWYSSRGPTRDGRTKPDVTAPGTYLDLPFYDEDSLEPTELKFTAGTSFAAPYVAGLSAALIEEADALGWATDPLVLKSVLLNSAQEIQLSKPDSEGELEPESWDGWSPTQTDRPLDIDQGAGEVSYSRARIQYFTQGEQEPSTPVERLAWDLSTSPSVGEALWYPFAGPVHAGATLTATLSWFREFAADGTALELDDLDLELWRTDGAAPTELVTLSNSRLDNVEHIHRFETPISGYYALAVRMLDDGEDALESNPYALAWSLPESPFLPGDLDLDGDVDIHDFSALIRHFSSGTLPSEGDVDGDGDVDLADFSAVKKNFGAQAVIPEPAAGWLLLGGAGSFLWVVRGRRSRRAAHGR